MSLCHTCTEHDCCPERAQDVRECVEYRAPSREQARAMQLAAVADWQRLCALINYEREMSE